MTITPSIYEYRDHEIKVHEEIRKRRRREMIEAIFCAPLFIAVVFLMLFV